MLEGLSNVYVFSHIVHWPQKKKNPGNKKTPKTQIVVMHVPSTLHLVSPGSKVCGFGHCLKNGLDAVCGRLLSFFSQLFFVEGLWQQKLFWYLLVNML
jgi:hypothetical protein